MKKLSELKPAAIDRMHRRLSVEKCLLAGVTSAHEMAARYGVSRNTIVKDIAWVYHRWNLRALRKKIPARIYRVNQLDHIARLALNSFEESRQDEITITTKIVSSDEHVDEASELCELPGESSDDGTKKHVTVTRKKRVGDPAFLAVAARAIKEASLVEGSAAPKQLEHRGTVNVDVSAVSPQIISPEDIERVLAINDRFVAAMNGSANTIEGTIAPK